MLQRHLLAQKRHLEVAIAKCAYPTLNLFSNASVLRLSAIPRPRLASVAVRRSVPKPTGHARPVELNQVIDTMGDDLEKTLLFIKGSPSLSGFFFDRKLVREVVKELAVSPTPGRALQLLEVINQFGRTLDASAYESVARLFGQSHKWDLMLEAVALAHLHLGRTTLRLLNWRARALMETAHFSLLLGVLGEFEEAGIKPDRRTFHIVIMGCLRNNDIEAAKVCLRCMYEAGYPMDATTHATVGNLYRSFGVDTQVMENALQSLHGLPPADGTNVVNRLIQACLDIDDLVTSRFLLSLFEATDDLDSVISLFFRQSRVDQEFVTSIYPATRVRPTCDTVAILVNYLIRKSDYDGAIQLVEKTASVGSAFTENLVVSLCHAYFLRGYGDSAIALISRLCRDPSLGALHSLLDGSSRKDSTPLIDLGHLRLGVRTCNTLLRHSLDRKGLACVPSVFGAMHANSITPNARTLELILSYMNKTQIPHARSLFQVLRGLQSTNVRPSLKHMHHIVAYMFRLEKVKYLRSAWASRSKLWTKPPYPPFRVGTPEKQIRLLEATDDYDPMAGLVLGKHLSYRSAAKPTVDALHSTGVKADTVMTFHRMRRHAVLHLDVESAHRIFRTLMARGMRPNEYHFGSLIEGYSLVGNFDAAKEVMNTAKESGIHPNVVMYTSLIAGYARQYDPDSAMRTFNEMISTGIAPDVPSIDALVSAYYANAGPREARDVLVKLWHHIEPFPETLSCADLSTLTCHFRSLHNSPSTGRVLSREERHALYDQIKAILRAYRKHFCSPIGTSKKAS
ncbi:hypothetical protein D9613_001902 [Agrocybe pediades]|uniref:Pentatricopeptide repeat-containing protein n=1 Tax=Agrocybe pediades TaxID=84607 RepID=A0A8H4R7E3_9AGAR|nr:hypothetical protein D9613_001902 [Agrocybe pediades]